MSNLTTKKDFNEAEGLRLDSFDLYVEDGHRFNVSIESDRRYIRMEDDVYFFKLDMAEAIQVRDWLNKVIP